MLRDRNGIDDEDADPGRDHGLRDRLGDRSRREHPGLRRVHTDIGRDDRDLLRDDLGRQRLGPPDAPRVLHGDGGDRGHPVHPEHAEGLEVRLDPCAAARVAPRDRQRARASLRGAHAKWSQPSGSSACSWPSGSVATRPASVTEPICVSGVPNVRSSSAAASATADVRKRRHQLVVLAAPERVREGRGRMHRDPGQLEAHPDTAGRAQARHVDREPVGNVDHRGRTAAGEELRLPDAGHRLGEAEDRVALLLVPRRSASREPEAGRRAAEETRRDDGLPRAGTRSRHRAARRDLSGQGHGDGNLAAARQVATDQRAGELAARLAHPAEQLHRPGRVQIPGERQGTQGVARRGRHRGDVADVDRDRLVPDLVGRAQSPDRSASPPRARRSSGPDPRSRGGRPPRRPRSGRRPPDRRRTAPCARPRAIRPR